MQILPTGARVDLDAGTTLCVVEADNGRPSLSAALVIHREGRDPEIRLASGDSPWQLEVPIDTEARMDVLLYMDDDTQQGRVEDRSPIRCRVGTDGFELDVRPDRHGAIILAEIYHHNGRRKMRARGDGWAFGIKALARKEGLPIEPFLPERERYDRQDAGRPDFPWDDSRRRRDRGALGSGSGVIVAVDHVVTNAHVVDGSRKQLVHGPDGDVQGRVLAVDEMHDLALVRVPGIGGRPMPIRQMGSLCLGEAIVACGYPLRNVLGDDLKMTHGNVSGLKGQGGSIASFQFSAPIGSGSSGGAVTDQNGNLVGIVAAALAHDTMRQMGAVSENTNFAVRGALVAELLSAHGIDWNTVQSEAGTPAELARKVRESVVSMTLS